MTEEVSTIQVFQHDRDDLKRLMPHLRNDAYRVRELLSKYQIVNAGVIPAPADADPGVKGIPYVEVQRLAQGEKFYIVNVSGAKTLVYLDKAGFVRGANGSQTGKKLESFLNNGCTVQPC